jgi:hypothetical protein
VACPILKKSSVDGNNQTRVDENVVENSVEQHGTFKGGNLSLWALAGKLV